MKMGLLRGFAPRNDILGLSQRSHLAKGSSGEVQCQLYVAHDQGYINREDFHGAKDLARQVVRLRRMENLINYLKDSRLKGSKFKKPPVKSMAEEMKEILARFNKILNDLRDQRIKGSIALNP